MSTRHMKRVYGGNVISGEDNDAASDTEISVTNDTKSKFFNVFDLVYIHIFKYAYIINYIIILLLWYS
jgi:uncharacterized membrane protein